MLSAGAPAQVREDMQGPLGALHEAARRVARVAADARMAVDVEDYVASFKADLVDAVTAWCRGARFAEVLKMCDVFEVRLGCIMMH